MMGQKQHTKSTVKWKQLSEKERYQIEILLKEKRTVKEIGDRLGRDRRTIEREIARGSVMQRDREWRDRLRYCADAGQRICEENAANKGRPLKVGHDHRLAAHIEKKIGEEQYAPDAVIGEIRRKGIRFETDICTKTVYNYIDKGIFLNISNKDLPVKRNGKRHKYRQVRKVALNNLKGRSIEERPKSVDTREDTGH